MPTAAADPFNHQRRSAAGCLCCGSEGLLYETQIVSDFLVARAWGRTARDNPTRNLPCLRLAFFDRGLSDAEAARYYRAVARKFATSQDQIGNTTVAIT